MELHALSKITTKAKRRLGQGHGSGRVKTSGRGTKGQKARHNTPLDFEGGGLPLTKRLPFLRGKGRNNPRTIMPLPVNLSQLQNLPKGSIITLEELIKHHIVSADQARTRGVKILGGGEITVSLTVKLPTSISAKNKIEKAQGNVEAS